MVGGITSRASVDNIEAVKMAIELTKMEGETVLKLINEQKQPSENTANPAGVGSKVDVLA